MTSTVTIQSDKCSACFGSGREEIGFRCMFCSGSGRRRGTITVPAERAEEMVKRLNGVIIDPPQHNQKQEK